VTLVDPGRPIPRASTAIHGITDEAVRGAPALDRVLPEAAEVIGDAVVVGHNVGFDLAVLARARRARRLARLRHRALDTRRLAAALHPEWRDFSLEQLARRLGVAVVARHTAEGDAVTAGRIFVALLPELETHRLRTVAEALWLERQARAL
jgi:DNA polymerase III alpha subunit (gram-positive type)